MQILVDSGFSAAIFSPKDQYHNQARRFATSDYLRRGRHELVLPHSVPTEGAFLARRSGGQVGMSRYTYGIYTSGFTLIAPERIDYRRASEIMRQYADNKFDFVDTMIMAMAERLNITHILTFDRRDFSVFRPLHTEYLTLLP